MGRYTRPLPSPHLSVTGGFKDDCHPSISTSWTHEARLQAREWKVGAPRANQRLEVQQFAVDALPHGSGFQTVAVIAAHMHLPAKGSRYGEGLDFHENKSGTFGGGGQAGWPGLFHHCCFFTPRASHVSKINSVMV